MPPKQTAKQEQATARLKADAAKVVAGLDPLTPDQRKAVREMFLATVPRP